MESSTGVKEVITFDPDSRLTTLSPGGVVIDNTKYGLVGLFVFIAVLITVVIIRRKCRHEQDLDVTVEEGKAKEKKKNNNKNKRVDSELSSDVFTPEWSQNVGSVSYNKNVYWNRQDSWKKMVGSKEIDVSCLTLGDQIGTGQFGCVYEGKLARGMRNSNDYGPVSHDRVAVKTLKGGSMEPHVIEAFLKEGMLMKDFDHPNVLSLIGVAFGDHGIPMIILPFMGKGSMKAYIMDPENKLTVRALLRMGLQVAEGMTYLSKHKFVHRDLAARNCMLDDRLNVKVADFGLSRDIYDKDYYASEDTKAKLPVKWMALESLAKGVYTTRSDVWSFGVLMWELMTRGVTPYPDISNWDVRSYIQSGRRLEQPEACPIQVYELMQRCWTRDPTLRPTFLDIAEELKVILLGGGPPQDTVGIDSAEVDYINMQVQAYSRQMSTSSGQSR